MRQHTTIDSGGRLLPEQAAYDVTYYDLHVRLYPEKRYIEGSVLVKARAASPLGWFVLDLDPRFRVSKVSGGAAGDAMAPLRSERRDARLWIALRETLQPGGEVQVRVEYAGKPREAPMPPWKGGFSWDHTEAGEPWIGTSCQREGADLWWPVKDHVSDEPDTMDIHITVPEPLVAASNGRLQRIDSSFEGTRTFHWHVAAPINAYNVTLNAAPYKKIEREFKSVSGNSFPVVFYVLPESYEEGKEFFEEIIAHLKFYEEILGPYPFQDDKYGVVQTSFLGMEHQSLTAYGADFDNGAMTGAKDWGFDALHHHELSHEWWGNLLTNADWSDMWLHEGFGTYMQALYVEKTHGIDRYHDFMASLRERIANEEPVAPPAPRSSQEIYIGDIYFKGAWILHTLRYLIGWEALQEVLRKFAYPNARDGDWGEWSCRFVTTADFEAVVRDVTGKDYAWFFDVYLRQSELPELVTERHGGTVSVRWEVPDNLPFPMPLDVQRGEKVVRVPVLSDMNVSLLPEAQDAGELPELDPRSWVLCKREG